jgi:hypothetical protein
METIRHGKIWQIMPNTKSKVLLLPIPDQAVTSDDCPEANATDNSFRYRPGQPEQHKTHPVPKSNRRNRPETDSSHNHRGKT